VEYDQRAHKLTPLAQFSFWVPRKELPGKLRGNRKLTELIGPSRIWPPSPGIGPGDLLSSPPPKLRVSPSRNNDGDQTDGELPSPTALDFDGPGLEHMMTNVPAVKVDNCPRPAESAIGDDGPLFRATIKSLEQKTSNLRTKMKKVLKRAEQARQAQIVCNDAFSAFMESLRDASTSGHAPGIQPALDHYFERTYREILTFEKNNELNLQKLIIDPLTKLYHMDLKQAESKKRDFEEESRDYYNYVSRYLGIRNDPSKEKKKIESETKYQTKRKNFELKRFDYSTFMQDLHGGRKEQEVLAQLTKYADAQARGFLNTAKKVQELLPELEALDYEVKETAKEFQLQRTEREERRRLLEKNNQQYVEPESVPSFIPPTTPNASAPTSSDILGFNHNTGFERLGMGTSSVRAVSSGSEGIPEGLMSPVQAGKSGSGSLKYRGYGENTVQVDKETERRKEGLLWALSRPGSHVDPKGLNKQAWHKYWVVLAGGQLCEYTNWKQKLGLHNDPINLKMASVREARNSERRFCFEVVTPQYKRVYQATSEEDMNNWISSINNAVKSTIESGGSIKNFDVSPISNETEVSALKNIPSALTGKSSHRDHHIPSSAPVGNTQGGVYRRTTVGARPGPQRRNSSNFNDDPEKLLQMVRDSDPSNSSCADCGSQVKTEWVSINLGIVLCIGMSLPGRASVWSWSITRPTLPRRMTCE
jgi:Arf-GAP/SH3 domain/ANK repeat/PH domain-containing protein